VSTFVLAPPVTSVAVDRGALAAMLTDNKDNFFDVRGQSFVFHFFTFGNTASNSVT